MNRYYQLGKLPWNMGASVPEALFVPPPNMAVAVHPLSNTPFRLALPKPPTPPPAPPMSDPPASTVAAVKTEVRRCGPAGACKRIPELTADK
eukprot:7671223-Lingulodinium_polyedra.AAC.1